MPNTKFLKGATKKKRAAPMMRRVFHLKRRPNTRIPDLRLNLLAIKTIEILKIPSTGSAGSASAGFPARDATNHRFCPTG